MPNFFSIIALVGKYREEFHGPDSMTSGDISDYSEAEQDAPMLIPAAPIKPGKKKAGGLGKKGKVFASKSKMLELVDRVNAVQEQKLGLLIERDVQKAYL